ncbi:hypothetical protein FACS1894217_04970 [Clostridia bacterium]|nr:hypothetical protein FACS1894217_04970 [Clostridia bacterium]
METDMIYNCDCLDGLKLLPDRCIDLIVTDPPYLIENTRAGGKSPLAKSIQGMNTEIQNSGLTQGFNAAVLDEMVRVLKTINLYIWCNHKQIPAYLDYFVSGCGCSFDILIWNKTNAMPLFNNKWLTDKEYCLYFRKSAYCNPDSYEHAKTVWHQPINAQDKKRYGHPTIKPLNIIETLIQNSSRPEDVILDPFLGSGTTAVAAVKSGRHYIGYELDSKYFDIACARLDEVEGGGIVNGVS